MTSSTLSVNIIDDIPTARPDADIVVAEDAANVGGNLLDDDTQGADGATVTTVTIGGTTIAINAVGDTGIPTANGVYTFTAIDVWSFNPKPESNAAPVDASLSSTLTEGDGGVAIEETGVRRTAGDRPVGSKW